MRCVLVMLCCAVLVGCGSKRDLYLSQIEGYRSALESGDLETAMTYLASDYSLKSSGPAVPRSEMRPKLAWDIATGHRMEWDPETAILDGNRVTVEATDFSRFYALLGAASGRRTERVFVFNHAGLIVQERYRTTSGQMPLQEKLNPFLDWMRKDHAEDLEVLLPDGRITYSGESGEAWLAQLEAWRDDIRLP